MKAILVEDDVNFCEIFLARLRDGVEKLGITIECEVCHNPREALQQTVVYDIYFLDIEMSGMNGLELAAELRARLIKTEIIFLSFHEQYVWRAFDVRPRAFIRKAQLEKDLPDALEVLIEQDGKRNAVVEISCKGNQFDKIKPMEILFCMSQEHYVRFVWDDGQSKLYRMKLDQAEEMLSKYHFIRTHSRYLVNSEYIQEISSDKIILANGQEIPISRANKRKIHMIVMNLREQKEEAGSG
ncbi:MAG: response regulator transcription factor [Lachnospiraceae bacterium]|nr:response regulator transcription factor [Lachnospiraceae bacterium]